MLWTDTRSFAGNLGGRFPAKAILCLCLCAVTNATMLVSDARADVLTGQWETLDVLDGEYRIHNNVWGATTAQEVTAFTNESYFEVTLSEHDQGGVAAYPFILKGTHWGAGGTTNSGFPIQISDVESAPFSWSIDTQGVGGTWNAAFESWFSTTGGTAPDAAELMIWIDYNGGAFPGGSWAGNVTIGGLQWGVYHASPWATWEHYIAYRLLTPTDEVNLDLKDFMDDSLARDFLESDWYLDNMEAGFEIWSDGEGLTTNSFSGEVTAAAAGLPGDFTGDGTVDAADYAAWRDGLGTLYTETEYDVWREHFGQSDGGAGAFAGTPANATVPEPSSIFLALGAVVALVALRAPSACRSDA